MVTVQCLFEKKIWGFYRPKCITKGDRSRKRLGVEETMTVLKDLYHVCDAK